jgi:hypothetical protein
MPTYNGVSFGARVPSGTWRPEWEQDANIYRTHVPYSSFDELQDGGRGNSRITVLARLTSDAALAALRAAVGITKRTLYDLFGSDYPSTMLVGVRAPKRMANSATWEVELDFEREG